MNSKAILLFIVACVAFAYFAATSTPDVSARDISGEHDVVMFTAPWCGYCDQARRYLQQTGVDYLELDIENSSQAQATFREVGGRGVPLIFIADERISGYSAQAYERALVKL